MHDKSLSWRRRLSRSAGLLGLGLIALATGVSAQTTITNQNSAVNPSASDPLWVHGYQGPGTMCAVAGCASTVIPANNPNWDPRTPVSGPGYYASSPPLTKFVDPLPIVPTAVPAASPKADGADYYELMVEDYYFQFHKEMNPAILRGYAQTNGGPTLAGLHASNLGYLGPQILSMRNVPTRVTMTNGVSLTGTTKADGKPGGLRLPVDETIMGAGSGPPVHLTNGGIGTHTRANAVGVNAHTTAGGAIYHAVASPAGGYQYHTAASPAGGYRYHTANGTVNYHATAGSARINNAGVICTTGTGCTVRTWAANATCTAAQAAFAGNPYQCTLDTFTLNTACTATELAMTGAGRPACGTANWAQYAVCTVAQLAIPGVASSCATETWAANTVCSPLQQHFTNAGTTGGGIACTTVSWTAGQTCNATQNANPVFACTATGPWIVGDVCKPYMPLTNNSPYYCKTTAAWAMGDYCTVAQANNPAYQCTAGDYSFDRALLHQHGGNTPWIADGTPHQWVTPVGDPSPYKRGLSNPGVPDMPVADGKNTYYYTNQNSARMMWYHDHTYGLTRLNVYAGEVSVYMLTDAIEQAMLGGPASTAAPSVSNVLKAVGLADDSQTATAAVGAGAQTADLTFQPNNRFGNTLGTTLVIQDKTFVWGADPTDKWFPGSSPSAPGALSTLDPEMRDPLWIYACGKTKSLSASMIDYAAGPLGLKLPCPTATGSLWYPHIYMPNTDPKTGFTTSIARWDYAPWVGPAGTIFNQTPPTVSATPESFMDTIVTNGKAYPFMNVPRKPMRFRVLNAANDRYLNLQLYYAVNDTGIAATGKTSTDPTTVCNAGGQVTANATNYAACSEVSMINFTSTQPANAYPVPTTAWIKNQTNDALHGGGMNTASFARYGGVPDPTLQVPYIQIGNEGGFLPQPIVHYNQSIDYETDPKNINLTNIRNNPVSNPPTCANCVHPYPGYTLFMGPGERADIIIDFGSIPDGATLILYNDAPAPLPGYDQRYDLFTGAPDMTAIRGPSEILKGQGPNTRTIMQFRVDGTISFPDPANPAGPKITSLPLPANWVEEVSNYAPQAASTAPLNVAIDAAFRAAHGDPIVSSTNSIPFGTAGSGARKYTDATPYYMGSIDPTAWVDMSGGTVALADGTAATCDVNSLLGCATTRLCNYGGSTPCAGGIVEFPTCAGAVQNPVTGIINNSAAPGYRKTCGFPVFTKAIAEDFDPIFGRMNAILGTEQTSLEANAQQTFGFYFVNPITERLHEGETQIWQVIHNGVDTHAIHFHLMNVQVINRIDWAGISKLPDAEERGWKELVKMNPLETTVIAVRMNTPGHNPDNAANNPPLPFTVPTNLRVSDVTAAMGEVDPSANALFPFMPFGNGVATYANAIEDFSWEYVWHCHLLGHEENDMMRPLVLQLDTQQIPRVGPPPGLEIGAH